MLNTSVVDCFVCPSTVCHQLPIQKATHKYILCAAYTLPSSITLDKLSAQFSCFRYFAILYLVLFAQIAFRPSDLSRYLGIPLVVCSVCLCYKIRQNKWRQIHEAKFYTQLKDDNSIWNFGMTGHVHLSHSISRHSPSRCFSFGFP